jgi:hypothetical protein
MGYHGVATAFGPAGDEGLDFLRSCRLYLSTALMAMKREGELGERKCRGCGPWVREHVGILLVTAIWGKSKRQASAIHSRIFR